MLSNKLSRRGFLRAAAGATAFALGQGVWVRGQEVVKVAIIPGSIGFADVYTGIEQGFFEDRGLQVERVSFLNGALANNALALGEVDFAPLVGGYVPFVRPAGLPYKIIAARSQVNGFSFLSSLALSSQDDIASVLRGQTVAVEALGSTITWAMALNYLSKAGLNPETDVNLVAVGGRAAAAAALQSGQAAATVLDGPIGEQLVQSGAASRWIDPLIPAQHVRWLGSGKELALAWITREDVIANRPQTVEALVAAANDTLQFLNQLESVEDLAVTLAPFFEGVEGALLQASLTRYLQTLTPDVSISRSLYEADLEKWVALKLVQDVPFEQAVEGAFAGTRD